MGVHGKHCRLAVAAIDGPFRIRGSLWREQAWLQRGVVSAATVLHVACRLLQEHCVLSVVLMQQWMLLRSADLPRLADELIRRLRGVVGTIPSELPICTIDRCRVSWLPLSYPAAAWPTGIRSPFNPCGSQSVAPSCPGNRPEGLRRQSAFCRARPMREPIRREATTQRSAAPVRGTDMRRAGHRVDQHGVVAASRHRAAARAAINRSIAADTSRAEDVLRRCHAPQSDSTKDGSHARDAADITNQCGRLSRR